LFLAHGVIAPWAFFGSSSKRGEGIDVYWGRWSCLLLLGGTTSVSSATDAGASDGIIRSWNLLDFYTISKLPVVDAEVDPPQQISPVSATTMNLVFISGLPRIFTGLTIEKLSAYLT
jgi:hypothetical protein